jgi:vitamin B12 transporter
MHRFIFGALRAFVAAYVVPGAVPVVILLGAIGQARAGDEPVRLNTVVVTATRIEQPIDQATQSISVVTADDIASRQAAAVADVLRDVPGVDVVQNGSSGNTASVFIRGANSSQTLVMVDGVEVNSPTLGDFNFGTLNTDNLDRVEILRGGGGTLYGSEAVGGVINVLTKRGEGAPQFSLLDEGGNGDTQRHRVSFSGAEGRVGVSGSLSYESTGGFRPVNDDYSLLTSSLRVDADVIEHGTFRGFFRFHDANLGLVNNLSFIGLPDPNARFSEERYLGKLEWEHRPVENLTYRIAGSVVHDTETFTDPDAATEIGGFAIRSRIPTQINTGEAQATYYEGNVGITTAGFEFKEKIARPKSLNVNFVPPPPVAEQNFSSSRSIYAGYMQQQIHLFDERLIGIGGVRVDDDEEFGREVSASWSVGYLQDWDGSGRWATRIKGSYAEGFKAPTFNDLFFPNFGSPNLAPETSSEYDGGIEQHLWQEYVTAEGTYFNRRTTNLIIAVCDPVTFLCHAQNVGRADVQGVESALVLRPIDDLTFRGTYTYLDYNVIGESGARRVLTQRPHNRAGASARYLRERIFADGDSVDVVANVNFAGERHDVIGGVDSAYTVTNAAVTYGFVPSITWLRRVELYTRIGNLFDRNYAEVRGFKAPPINFVAGTQLTF